MTDKKLLTAEEVGKEVGVSGRTVLEWSREGLIPRIPINERVIRFNLAEVVEALRDGYIG